MRKDCRSGLAGRAILSLAAAVGTLACGEAARADLIFTKIIDDSGSFGLYANFGQGPVIDASGRVIFHAERLDNIEGYYTGIGGAISTIIENGNTEISSFSPSPQLRDNGLMAFAAFPDAGGQAIYRLDTATSVLTTIADSDGPLVSLPWAHLSSNGNVAFYALQDTFHDGIYKGTGGPLTPIADTTPGDFDELGFLPSINDSGIVAFQGQFESTRGIYLGDGGTPVPIAHSSGEFALFMGRAPMINNAGQVVFLATLDTGPLGMFKYDDGEITLVADNTGGFQGINNEFGFNDAGQIVFRATLDDGRRGLFFGHDPELHKIIATGDPLFGSTLQELEFFRGLSSEGEVAFRYLLTNGLTGIAKVSAIPEPATAGLFAAAAGLLLLRRRRRADRQASALTPPASHRRN